MHGTPQAGHLERFLREAQTAAGLHHTNIVPVFDVGQTAGMPFYAMQFIDGRGLDRREADAGDATVAHGEPASQGVRETADTTVPVGTRASHDAEHFRWVAEVGIQDTAEGADSAPSRDSNPKNPSF